MGDQFVYTSGQSGMHSNGTDALRSTERILHSFGIDLSSVVSCLFFVRDNSKIWDLFSGFYHVFNEENPPPPTRNELQAVSECENCAVTAKCVAALPTVL